MIENTARILQHSVEVVILDSVMIDLVELVVVVLFVLGFGRIEIAELGVVVLFVLVVR